ncbi:MAG: hypothetical protein KBB94_08935 [Legionellaceae bacterium]|nr:hypothetical protein [Legionellaceae bacterium]MBP9775966.1 hypothetical protein [Legionellaceae bacterium]
MMTRMLVTYAILLGAGFAQNAFSISGSLFNVSVSGAALSINTTLPNHFYSSAGITINTPGFTYASTNSGCSLSDNGYCLFSVSDKSAATIMTSGPSGDMVFTLCLNGVAGLSCQNYYSAMNISALIAVGNYTNTTTNIVPLSYTSTNGGNSWSVSSALSLPGDVATSVANSRLRGVTCDTTRLQCTAVGSYKNTSSNIVPLSYTSTNGGNSWSLSSTVPLPGDVATTTATAVLNGVACDSTGLQCTAVGSYKNTSNNIVPLSHTSINGGNSWSLSTTLPLPVDVITAATANSVLNGVACDSTRLQCTAVGSYKNTSSKTVPFSYTSFNGGNSWSLSTTLPLPADVLTTATANSVLNGVACDSTRLQCTAVGSYRNTSNRTVPFSYTSTNGGNSWSLSSALPLPGDVITTVTANSVLSGVTCDSTRLQCTAVGSYRNTSSRTVPFSYTSTNGGNSWSLSSALPLPGDVITSATANSVLSGVTCDSTRLQCTAVGSYRNTSNNIVPLSYTSTNAGNSWSLSSTLPLPQDVATSSANSTLRGVG